MRGLFINLLLALVWMAVSGSVSLESLLVGFGVGFAILLPARALVGGVHYHRQVLNACRFLLFFAREMVRSSLRVAAVVLSPRPRMTPAVVAIPLRARSATEIVALANLVSLTPGTLSLDVSNDRRVLYVHAMLLDAGVTGLRAEIAELESKLLAVMRGCRESDRPLPLGDGSRPWRRLG